MILQVAGSCAVVLNGFTCGDDVTSLFTLVQRFAQQMSDIMAWAVSTKVRRVTKRGAGGWWDRSW